MRLADGDEHAVEELGVVQILDGGAQPLEHGDGVLGEHLLVDVPLQLVRLVHLDDLRKQGLHVGLSLEEPEGINEMVYLRKEGMKWFIYGYKEHKEMFYLTTHSTHFIYGYKEHKEMFYLTTHSTHFIYGYKEHKEMFNLTTLSTHFIYSYKEHKEMFYLTTHSTHFYLRL